MKSHLPHVLPAVLMALAAALPAHAQNWGQIATISSTLGVNADRLCIGEGLRGDIGCPSYAPYVSGTSGFVGVGTNQPSRTLHVEGNTYLASNTAFGRVSWGPSAQIYGTHSSWGQGQLDLYGYATGLGTAVRFVHYTSPRAILADSAGSFTLTTWPNNDGTGTSSQILTVRKASTTVGILETNPQATLHVSGTARITSWTAIARNASPTTELEVFGRISATNFIGDGSQLTGIGQGDRITSGTTSVIATRDRSVTITTSGTERLVIGENGNVGIGTGTPSSTMNIFATGTSGQNTELLRLQTHHLTPTLGASVRLAFKANNATNADMAFIDGVYDSVTPGLRGMGLGFWTSEQNSVATEKLRIDRFGRVGIGTSAPSTTLHVMTGANTTGLLIQRNNNGNGEYASLYFMPSTVAGAKGGMFFERTNSNGRGSLHLATTNDPTVGAYLTPSDSKLVITHTGNVGIGTTSPDAKLDVYGTISATNFYGDGSGLTGIVASSADRIVSGTTKVVANNGGNIDFMTGSTVTGYYTPGGILAAVGISTSTNQASFTTVYASGNVGIGNNIPTGGGQSYGLTFNTISSGVKGVGATGNDIHIGTTLLAGTTQAHVVAGYGVWIRGSRSTGIDASGPGSALGLYAGGTEFVRVTTAGNVGIGTTSPAKTLDVSGTAQVISRTLIGGAGAPSATLQVSGSLLLAGNDNIPCTDSVLGLVRRNPTTGRLQACR